MSTRLIPPTSELTEPYWDAARKDELVVQQCTECGQRPFPPRAHCPQCGSAELDWRAVSGRGTVYSYTIAHRPPHPVFADQCPMAIAVVELAEGPRMISNIVGCEPGDVAVGMAVQVGFEQIDDSDVALPVFFTGDCGLGAHQGYAISTGRYQGFGFLPAWSLGPLPGACCQT